MLYPFSPSDKKRRSDLDAIRAFAIFIVLGYHLQIPWFNNGFIGVDIFFVLSGYLITELLLRNALEDRSDIIAFYWRRAHRLLPAFLFMLGIVAILVWLLVPLKIVDFAKNAFWSLGYLSNMYYYFTSGYFSTSAQLNFLLHTWSLSIEVQFYLLYPLLLFLLAKKSKNYPRSIVWSLVILLCISILWMILLGPKNEKATFYLFPSRLWEFLCGALILFIRQPLLQKLSSFQRMWIAILSWISLFALVLLLEARDFQSWPSIATILPLLCVSVIILMEFDLQVYRFPLIANLAKYSYGLYLWHWPLIVLATYLGMDRTWTTSWMIIFISSSMAIFSYQRIERRMIRRKKKLLIPALVMSLGMLLLTHPRIPNLIFDESQLDTYRTLSDYKIQTAPAQYGFLRTHLQYHEPFDSLHTASQISLSDKIGNYLLIGDCHAGMFSYSLKRVAQQHGVNLVIFSMDETFPVKNAPGKYVGPRDQMRYLFDEFIPSHQHQFEKIILMADYTNYTAQELKTFFKTNHDYFNLLKLPVTYLGQTKKYSVEYPIASVQAARMNSPLKTYELSGPHHVNRFIKDLKVIDYIEIINFEFSEGGYFMHDANHYSLYGTEMLSSILAKRLFEAEP